MNLIYIGKKKEHPDLAIEVNITSGDPSKLEKYKRLLISEVWLWHNNTISVYCLRDADITEQTRYENITKSELLPDLDLNLLVTCVLIKKNNL